MMVNHHFCSTILYRCRSFVLPFSTTPVTEAIMVLWVFKYLPSLRVFVSASHLSYSSLPIAQFEISWTVNESYPPFEASYLWVIFHQSAKAIIPSNAQSDSVTALSVTPTR